MCIGFDDAAIIHVGTEPALYRFYIEPQGIRAHLDASTHPTRYVFDKRIRCHSIALATTERGHDLGFGINGTNVHTSPN